MTRVRGRWRSLRAVTLAASFALSGVGASCRQHATTGDACGAEIADADLWREYTDAELAARIDAARRCAATHGTRVMLEFIAPWCEDCREMTRLDRTADVSRVIHARYELVRVNVGQWDRHRALLARYGIDRIAAYVVLDARGEMVARTVLEPITGGHGPLTAARWIEWLEAPR